MRIVITFKTINYPVRGETKIPTRPPGLTFGLISQNSECSTMCGDSCFTLHPFPRRRLPLTAVGAARYLGGLYRAAVNATMNGAVRTRRCTHNGCEGGNLFRCVGMRRGPLCGGGRVQVQSLVLPVQIRHSPSHSPIGPKGHI